MKFTQSRKIIYLFTAIISFGCASDEIYRWQITCETTSYVNWSSYGSEKSVSKSIQLPINEPTHLFYLNEEGSVFVSKTNGYGPVNVYFGVDGEPVDVSFHSSSESIFLTYYEKELTDAVPHYAEIRMNDSELSLRTKDFTLSLDYVADSQSIGGYQYIYYGESVHTFECHNITEDRWNILFKELSQLGEGLTKK